MRKILIVLSAGLLLAAGLPVEAGGPPDTGQWHCYGTTGGSIPCPEPGDPLFGQDANYVSRDMLYDFNGDGTITDLNTGLMWQQTPGDKVAWNAALAGAETLDLAGFTDWRVPTIKELYSLIDFNGVTGQTVENSIPYLDVAYFDFEYGDTNAGERIIDAQYWSSTEYVSTTMNGIHTVFGVNFADGRIKGYGTADGLSGEPKRMFVRYVRGPAYGANDFVNNGDGTLTETNSGLTWLQDDSGAFNAGSSGAGRLAWAEALAFCETLDFAGASDWRLPDAKELQSIVDYTRAPDLTGSAAIDPLFNVTPITDVLGQLDYPYFWTSTTHLDGRNLGSAAVYIAFGEALGYMEGPNGGLIPLDVHGAGAQRSDPKAGDPQPYTAGRGPQGDVIGINNFARCVRGGEFELFTGGEPDTLITELEATFDPTLGDFSQSGQTNSQTQPGQGQPVPSQPGQGQPAQGQPGQPGGQPPQEAVDACTNLNLNDPCTITTPQGALSGTCLAVVPGTVACVPASGPGAPPG